GQLGLEWIARHRSSFQHTACAVRKERELLVQGRGDRVRDVDSRQRDLGTAARKALAGDRPGELLEIEGVATALLVEDVDPFAYQLASLRLRQGAELHARERAGAMSSLERCCEPLGQLVRPDGH